MHCPKETTVELLSCELTEHLSVRCCPTCQGNWIPFASYQRWQAINQGLEAVPAEVLPLALDSDFQPAPLDGRAGLCPECGTYLKRARLNLRRTSFYVESCPLCSGIWCDRGEWEIFESLGLHSQIPLVFNADWQARIRVLEQVERQRLVVVDKLGPEIAERVFELADLLKQHPQGDIGVAYLMRKFDGSPRVSL